MTMPDERTRALRFGWEFLLDLRDEGNLTDAQRNTVEELLRHYPSGAEIKKWAKDCEQDEDPWPPRMAPEEQRPRFLSDQDPVYPDTIERAPTTPQQRTLALCRAYEFFRFGLSGSGRNNLPERLGRQIPYVLRHFPEPGELDGWAKSDEWAKQKDPKFKLWLMPEEAP
jgi:hypothetical protein